jgi:hypothetical protein
VRLFASTLVVTALLGLGTAAPAARARAQLSIVGHTPLVVIGTGFASGESVRVTASITGHSEQRRVTAGAAGRLKARFTLRWTTCEIVAVTAAGSRGSRATLKIVPVCAAPGAIG